MYSLGSLGNPGVLGEAGYVDRSTGVALDMAVAGEDARGLGEGGAQEAALLDVAEVLVRRWICVIYAALHKNDWASADGFLHPRVQDTFLPVSLLASLGRIGSMVKNGENANLRRAPSWENHATLRLPLHRARPTQSRPPVSPCLSQGLPPRATCTRRTE